MKILCFIDSIGSGGAQRQLVGLADLLKKEGDEVIIMYYHNVHFFRSFLEKKQIKWQYIPESKNRLVKFYRFAKAVSFYSPDVVIAYLDGPSIMSCLMRLFGMKFRLIVSERSLTEFLNIKRRIKFFLYRWSDCIITNSYAENRFIKTHFQSLIDKVYTITNFVDTDFFTPNTNSEPLKTEITPLHILCVARIGIEKNVLYFLETIDELVKKGHNLQVDWFGHPGSKDYYHSCLQKCSKLNLNEVVHFHEASSHIQEEYRHADVLCLPSLYEGFPNVIGEAMASGLPILCSRISDNAHIVSEGINGFLFNPHSLNEMIDAFTQFIKLPSNEKKEMGKRNREVALKKFSKEKFIHEYKRVIQKIYIP